MRLTVPFMAVLGIAMIGRPPPPRLRDAPRMRSTCPPMPEKSAGRSSGVHQAGEVDLERAVHGHDVVVLPITHGSFVQHSVAQHRNPLTRRSSGLYVGQGG